MTEINKKKIKLWWEHVTSCPQLVKIIYPSRKGRERRILHQCSEKPTFPSVNSCLSTVDTGIKSIKSVNACILLSLISGLWVPLFILSQDQLSKLDHGNAISAGIQDAQRLGTSLAVQGLRLRASNADAWVQSLIGELGSHMPCSAAKKKKKKMPKGSMPKLNLAVAKRYQAPDRRVKTWH